jgi:hypothetical protein
MEALDNDGFGERTATFQPVLDNIRVEKHPISASSIRKHLIDNDEDGEETSIFQPVLDNIRFEKLPILLLSVRKLRQFKDLRSPDGVELTTDDCSITYPLLYGSYHIVFPLEFTDGLRWALTIPAAGHRDKFDESAARALTSEALTLQLLKRETTIPVPEVYSFDTSFDNCPFILMEFMVGIPLNDCWFDKGASKALVAERRARTLLDLAAAMVQMNKFTYTLGGSPTYDEDGNPTGIGPLIPLTETDDPEDPENPYRSNTECEEFGPFTDQKSFLLCYLDGHEPPHLITLVGGCTNFCGFLSTGPPSLISPNLSYHILISIFKM